MKCLLLIAASLLANTVAVVEGIHSSAPPTKRMVPPPLSSSHLSDPGASLDGTYSWDHPKYRAVRSRIEMQHNITSNCTENFITVPIDNFAYTKPEAEFPETFQIRYYECLSEGWSADQPIYFYTGNESPIEAFMSWTGIMWENAAAVGAKLIWAEHRYFGKSRPWMNESMPSVHKLKYLTPDQALADYSVLIEYLRTQGGANNSAIIGFGGSYGGLLTAWMRQKYPWALDGGLASSAPIDLFFNNLYGIGMVATEDATAARGSVAGCDDNIRMAFAAMQSASLSELSRIFDTCAPLSPQTGGAALVMGWAESALIAMAQSSYPFENNLFLFGEGGNMPPYPLQAACKIIGGTPYSSNTSLLESVAQAMQIYFNSSKTSKCNDVMSGFPLTGKVTIYLWEYIACTTVPIASATNGVTDMFFDAPFSKAALVESCQAQYGGSALEPNYNWFKTQYGGKLLADVGSNIIFSNGQYDPIIAGGVLSTKNKAVSTIVFPALGHTGDLAFSSPQDSKTTIEGKKQEIDIIKGYISEKKQK